ncbi:dipeptidase [Pelagibacteraceae bacterium]|nr:dipeptidase [Pelagibacteraceae bacterium]
MNEIDSKYSNNSSRWIAKQHFLQKNLSNICPSIDVFIDHIEYIVKKIGIDFVGIGSDYDGLDCLPKGWNDCLDHMIISDNLEKRGFKLTEIEKIMGNNFLRVLEEINY